MQVEPKVHGKLYCIFRYLYNRYVRRNSPGSLPIILSLLVEPKATIVDVGANVGDWVRAVNKAAPWRSHFICFEANPTLKIPQDLVSMNIDWRNIALGSAKSVMELVINSNHRLGYLKGDEDFEQGLETVKVDVGLLDDVDVSRSDRVFLKIDVEGAEKLVLDGGLKFIEKSRPCIFLETYEPFAQRYNYSSKEVLTVLEELNYEIYWINAQDHLSRIVPSELDVIPGIFSKYIDFLAIPKEQRFKNILTRLILG
jgi:FkbM family methyltransferase